MDIMIGFLIAGIFTMFMVLMYGGPAQPPIDWDKCECDWCVKHRNGEEDD